MANAHDLLELATKMGGLCGRALEAYATAWLERGWTPTPANCSKVLRSLISADLCAAMDRSCGTSVAWSQGELRDGFWRLRTHHSLPSDIREEAAEIGLAMSLVFRPEVVSRAVQHAEGRQLGRNCRWCWRNTDGQRPVRGLFGECHIHEDVVRPAMSSSPEERQRYKRNHRERQRALRLLQVVVKQDAEQILMPTTDFVPITANSKFRLDRQYEEWRLFDPKVERWEGWLRSVSTPVHSFVRDRDASALCDPLATMAFLEDRHLNVAEADLYSDLYILRGAIGHCHAWLTLAEFRRPRRKSSRASIHKPIADGLGVT